MIIGICGKSNSGKSMLASKIIELTNNKAIQLDIDKIGHKVLLLDEVKEGLVKTFGPSVVKNNVVDRKELSKIVFDSKDKMDKLTDITWGPMQVEINDFLKTNKNKIVILDWLLLPVTQYFDMCDIKILLDIPYDIRKQRAIKRDKISEEDFDLREKASFNYNSKDFDYVLKENDNKIIETLIKLVI